MANNSRLNDFLRPNQLYLNRTHAKLNPDGYSYDFNIGKLMKSDNKSALYLSLLKDRISVSKVESQFDSKDKMTILDKPNTIPLILSFELMSFIKSYMINVYQIKIEAYSIIDLYSLPYLIVSLVNTVLLNEVCEDLTWDSDIDRSLLGYDWETFRFTFNDAGGFPQTVYCYPTLKTDVLPDWIDKIKHKIILKSTEDYRQYLRLNDNLDPMDEIIEQTFAISFGPEIGKCGCKVLEMPSDDYRKQRNIEYKHNTYFDLHSAWANNILTPNRRENLCATETLVPMSERLLSLYTDIIQITRCQDNLDMRWALFGEDTYIDDKIFFNRIPTQSFPRLNNINIWDLIPIGYESIAATTLETLPIIKFTSSRYKNESATCAALPDMEISNFYHTTNYNASNNNNFNSGAIYSGQESIGAYGPSDLTLRQPAHVFTPFRQTGPVTSTKSESLSIAPELPCMLDETYNYINAKIIDDFKLLFNRYGINTREKAPKHKSMALYSQLISHDNYSSLLENYNNKFINNLAWPYRWFMSKFENKFDKVLYADQPCLVDYDKATNSIENELDEPIYQGETWLYDKYPNFQFLNNAFTADQTRMEYASGTLSYLGIHPISMDTYLSYPGGFQAVILQQLMAHPNKYDIAWDPPADITAGTGRVNNPFYAPAINNTIYFGCPDWTGCDYQQLYNTYSFFKPIMEKETLIECKGDGTVQNPRINRTRLLVGGLGNLKFQCHDLYDNSNTPANWGVQRKWLAVNGTDGGQTLINNKSLSRIVTLDWGTSTVENFYRNFIINQQLGIPYDNILYPGFNQPRGNIMHSNFFPNRPSRLFRDPGGVSQDYSTRGTLRLVNKLMQFTTTDAVFNLPQICRSATTPANMALTDRIGTDPQNVFYSRSPAYKGQILKRIRTDDYPAFTVLPAPTPEQIPYNSKTANNVLEKTTSSFIPVFDKPTITTNIWTTALPFDPISNIILDAKEICSIWSERVYNQLPKCQLYFLENQILPNDPTDPDLRKFYNKPIPAFDNGRRCSYLAGNAYFDLELNNFLNTEEAPNDIHRDVDINENYFIHIWAASSPYNVASNTISNINIEKSAYQRATPDIRCVKKLDQLFPPTVDIPNDIYLETITDLTITIPNHVDNTRYDLHDYSIDDPNNDEFFAGPVTLAQTSAAYDRKSHRLTQNGKVLSQSVCGQYSNVFALRAYENGIEDSDPFCLWERELGCIPCYISVFELADTDVNLQINAFGEHVRSFKVNSDQDSDWPADVLIENPCSDCLCTLHPRITQYTEVFDGITEFQNFRWSSKLKNGLNVINSFLDPMLSAITVPAPRLRAYESGTNPGPLYDQRPNLNYVSNNIAGIVPQLLPLKKTDAVFHYKEGNVIESKLITTEKIGKLIAPKINTDTIDTFSQCILILCREVKGDVSRRKKIIGSTIVQITVDRLDGEDIDFPNYDPIMNNLLVKNIWKNMQIDHQVLNTLNYPIEEDIVEGGINNLNIWFEYEDTGKVLTHQETVDFGLECVISILPLHANIATYGKNTNYPFGLNSY